MEAGAGVKQAPHGVARLIGIRSNYRYSSQAEGGEGTGGEVHAIYCMR